MSAWQFVIAAYAAGVALILCLLAWAFASMRRAETKAEALKRP